MIKNSLMKFIDSCVGNIARKIEDEFNESDHPRDKGGRFTSKGGEGRGGGKQEKSSSRKASGDNVVTTSMEFTGDEEDAKQLAEKYGFDYKLKYPKGSPYATIKLTGDKDALRKYAINEGFGSEEDAREFVPELFEGSEGDDGKQEKSSSRKASGDNVVTTSMEFTGDEEDAKQLAEKYGFDYKLKYPKGSPYATIKLTGDKDALRKYAINEGFGSEEDAREFVPELFEGSEGDDEGYMGVSKEELAEEEDDDDPYEQDYEEGTSTTNLYGDKKQAPAVINALQYQYDGDAKKVGYIVRHLNSVTTNPEIWGEYTVKEIIDDIEDRYGKLDSMAKRHIDTYLRKTKPSEWDSETEYWKQKNKNFPGPKEPAFYE